MADGNEVPGGVAGMAVREAQRRQEMVKASQTLFTAGSRAYADKSYGEAMDNFKAAFETVPAVPAVADQRRVFFKRYQSASLAFARLKIDEARWAEAEAVLDDVISTAQKNSVPGSLIDPEVKRMLQDLRERDDRYNMATSPRHLENVELVKSKLILAKGYLELGDYDRAERSYHEVLAVDAYNTAARRGLEDVERHRMDYFDVARDHTRAANMRQVAEAWESPVPQIVRAEDLEIDGWDTALGGSTTIESKLNSIIIPRLEFNGARIADVLDFLSQTSQELDVSEPDPSKRGVSFVIDASGSAEAATIPDRLVTVKLSNVPLAAALKYVTQQVRLGYRVDSFAVIISPEADLNSESIITRSYSVPPGFISGGTPSGGGASPADPFADPVESQGVALKRITAQEFLEQNGIAFGEGASARFVPSTSTLIVRNTPTQLQIVESIVQAARDTGSKLVKVRVKTISIEENALRQLGVDWLLGASNLGSSPRVFFGGGTDGNTTQGTSASDYIFNQSGIPVGMNPVTAGLRTGDLAATQSIEDVLNRSTPDSGLQKAPGVFSVAGVFTDPQFQMVIRALNQSKASDQLFDSHVVTKPGQIARIEQIREFIYPTEYDPPEIPNQIGSDDDDDDDDDGPPSANLVFPATPATPTAFETRGLGSIIEVEPTVAADNLTVNVNITADFSDFIGFINYGTPIRNANFTQANGEASVVTENRILMPVFESIKETTNVTVWDGQTVAIGGYHGESITGSNDKVPGLGDLPGVGRAFRSSTSNSIKNALLIFVTIELIDPGGNPINAKPEDPTPEFTRNTPPLSPYPAVGAPPAGIYQAK